MQIARFWSKATQTVDVDGIGPVPVRVWGSSDTAQDAADRHAKTRLGQLVERIRDGGMPDAYLYSSRPLREELLEVLDDDASQPIAAITRNAYGSIVLNTARVMFVDIDYPRPGLWTSLLQAFGFSKDDAAEQCLQRVRDWHQHHPDWAMRVYRTFKGLRLLVTHDTFDPDAKSTRDVLNELGSDRLYIKLCEVQRCFRARLTPKSWRMGVARPLRNFPRTTTDEQTAFDLWLSRYHDASEQYATAQLIETLGRAKQSAYVDGSGPVARIVEWHDRICKSSSDLPLA